MTRLSCLLGSAALSLLATQAGSATLSNGPGDGSVTVGVDAFGAFGSSVGDFEDDAAFGGVTDAFFDPVGEIGESGTTFASGIAIGFREPDGDVAERRFLSSGFINDDPADATDVAIGAQTGTSLESSFSLGALDFDLDQSLVESFDDDLRVGSLLNQVYTITNTADEAVSFDVVRYLDGDLSFDESIADGGGRIIQNGNEILFETDAATPNDESVTFVGITGTGGETPATNRFEVSEFSDLVDKIEDGGDLGDFVQNDFRSNDGFDDTVIDIGDGFIEVDGEIIFVDETFGGPDGFIDVGEEFDVTMALRNVFDLAPGETATYTTQTLFGNAVPPEPGSIEALPLLPEEIDQDGGFVFRLAPEDIEEGEIIFFDPVIAIGYSYTVEGAEFDSVQAPSLAAVNDPDGYTLEFMVDGETFSVAIAPGEQINFGDFDISGTPVDGVTAFTILGISPLLALDPGDGSAFVTGVAFEDIAGPVTFVQTPISVDAAVPLPAPFLLLGSAIFGLALVRRSAAA